MWRLSKQLRVVSRINHRGLPTGSQSVFISATTNASCFSTDSSNSLSAESTPSFLNNAGETVWVDGMNQSVTAAATTDTAAQCIDSSAAIAQLGYYPSEFAMWYLDSLHAALGSPWWLTIIASTAIIRAALLPVIINGRIHGERMKLAKPELEELRTRPMTTPEDIQAFRNDSKRIHTKYNVKPLASLAAPVFQLPVMYGMFMALRHGTDALPSMADGFANGGIYWFQNLAVVDPTYVLPALNCTSMLLVMAISSKEIPESMRETLKMAALPLSMVTFFVCSEMSAGLNLYWVANNALSLVQTGVFRIPAIKNVVCPEGTPKPVEYFVAPPSSAETPSSSDWFQQVVNQEKKKFRAAQAVTTTSPTKRQKKKKRRSK